MAEPSSAPRRSLRSRWRALLGDRRGATAIEYGLIVSLIVITMFAALQTVGNVTVGLWNNISSQVQSAH